MKNLLFILLLLLPLNYSYAGVFDIFKSDRDICRSLLEKDGMSSMSAAMRCKKTVDAGCMKDLIKDGYDPYLSAMKCD